MVYADSEFTRRLHLTTAEMAREIGCDRQTVVSRMKRLGLELPKGRPGRPKGSPGRRLAQITPGPQRSFATDQTTTNRDWVPESLEGKINRMAYVGHPPGVIADICGITRKAVAEYLGVK